MNIEHKASPAAIAAVFTLQSLIQQGKVGLIFNGPDFPDIEWSPEAVQTVILAVFAADPSLVGGEWITDLVNQVTSIHRLMRQHPNYGKECEAWERGDDPTPFASEAAEHLHFDNIERAKDMGAV